MSLAGSVVIFTGTGSGIGREIARTVAALGALVVIAEIDPEGSEATRAQIASAGGSATYVQTDVAVEASIGAMVQRTMAEHGSVYGLVNNASIERAADATALTLEAWDTLLNVNLRGVFCCSKTCLPHMREQGRGSIVNIALVHASFGFADDAASDTSKGGVAALTRTLAIENAPHQIRVNAVCPGYIGMPLWDAWLATCADPEEMDRRVRESHPLRRRGQPRDVAHLVKFLLSDESSWITGTSIVVDGGMSAQFFEMPFPLEA